MIWLLLWLMASLGAFGACVSLDSDISGDGIEIAIAILCLFLWPVVLWVACCMFIGQKIVKAKRK